MAQAIFLCFDHGGRLVLSRCHPKDFLLTADQKTKERDDGRSKLRFLEGGTGMGKAFKLRNGLLLLSTEAPGGVYNATQLQKIAALADGPSAVVKATEDQRLALFVPSDQAAQVAQGLKSVGLGIRHYQDGLHQPVNCLGELCPDHLQAAMGTSMELTRELANISLSTPLKIGINGCARCCVATHTLDISIIGDSHGYRISLGGKNSQIPEMASFMAEGVPAGKLPKLVAKVIQVYKDLAGKDETLQDVMERCGSKRFIEALAPYSQDAAQGDPFAGEGHLAAVGIGDGRPEIGDADDAAFAGGAQTLGIGDLSPADMTTSDNLELAGEALTGNGAGDEIPDIALGESAQATSSPLAIDVPIAEEDFDFDPQATDKAADDTAFLEVPTSEFAGEILDGEGGSFESGEDSAEDIVEEIPLSAEPEEFLPGEADVTGDELALDETTEIATEIGTEESLHARGDDASLPEGTSLGDGDDMSADEIDGDEADAFEEKLNALVAEEESVPQIEDINSEERLEAMKLVEAGAGSSSADLVGGALQIDRDFDNLGIDDETHTATSPTLATAPRPTPRAGSGSPRASSLELAGFDFLPGGRVSLSFTSGAQIALDPRVLAANSSRELTVAGKRVAIVPEQGGVSIDIDGVSIFVPMDQAA